MNIESDAYHLSGLVGGRNFNDHMGSHHYLWDKYILIIYYIIKFFIVNALKPCES